MTLLHLAAVGALGFAAVACGSSDRNLPTQPAVPVAEPRPDPPPPPPPDARRIDVGAVTTDILPNSDAIAGCPPLGDPYPGARMPCRHFEVVASGDGILRVEVAWTPNLGAEGVMLIVAGIEHDNRLIWNAPVGTHRVLAGATYGITVVYDPSHYEYVYWGPDPIGEFTIRTTIEPRTWR